MQDQNFEFDGSAVLRGLLTGSGIQVHLDNKDNTEIAVNRPFEIWTENQHGWQKHNAPIMDYAYLQRLAKAFAVYNKMDISQQKPICSGIFPDGQRGQVIIPTACEVGTVSITIRQPSIMRFTLEDYEQSGRLDSWADVSGFQTKNTVLPNHLKDKILKQREEITYLNRYLGIPKDVSLQLYELQLLKAKADRDIKKFIKLSVSHRTNMCLIGATGSGKTTFTKAVCDLVPKNTRILTIEDTPELDLPHHRNKVHMFYKDVSSKALLHASMRMKPDRIFLTELRGDEAFDYLNALNTGHAGSITTVHANNSQRAYYRIANLIKQSSVGVTMDFDHIMQDCRTTIDVMLYLHRTHIDEIFYDPIEKYRLMQLKHMGER
ncbi:Type II/IV secretion system protein [Moraxella macacae 0408225]|uniref:Type II/IV secretion system protein n=1 Tax=Moraxella macacae 0408225 TaxID=1230338 RepID=L2F921_9GAMM|nr:ATPase, T2SS/T4P/T4SS family [Moraxella macacae]ELA09261.1 Type II/IV secretion system protein [Moraxella macacae 0408225]